MSTYDQLIGFIEREAEALRDRIAGLRERDIASGIDTGEGSDTRLERMRADAESRLADVESHLSELRQANADGR
jgi:hypothetical protein